jgi:tetratricopeptide (TPR) repeat protein
MARALYHEVLDTINIAYAHLDIAWVFSLQDDLDSAMVHSTQVLDYAEASRDTALIASAYNNLGTIHKKMGNLKKAEEIYLAGIALYDHYPKMAYDIAGLYNNLGILYKSMGQFDKALEYYGLLEQIALLHDHRRFLMSVYNNRGIVYNLLSDYLNAEIELEKAVHLAREMNIAISLCDALNHLAVSYLRQGKFEQALPAFSESILLSEQIGSGEKAIEAHQTAKEYYLKTDNPKMAVVHMESHQALKDSLFQIDKAQQINELQGKYEAGKKDAAILELNKNAEIQQARNRLLMYSIILLLAFGSAVFYAFYQKRQRDKWALITEKELAVEKGRAVALELEYKSKELTANVLRLAAKNEFLIAFKNELSDIRTLMSKDPKYLTSRLIRKLDQAISDDEMWDHFTQEFIAVHPVFFQRISRRERSFSKAELRLIALTKMNLSSKDIANVLHISDEGVKKARQRLRKKLELDTETNLQEYLLNT